MDWNLVIPLAVGALALVAVGFFVDRGVYKRRRAILESPPDSPILDSTEPPTYIDATTLVSAPPEPLSDQRRQDILTRLESAPSVKGGYASPDFITDPASGWSVVEDARVLVVDEASDPRDVYSVLASVQESGRGFVLVSPVLGDEVVEWLAMNAKSGVARCLGVRVDDLSEAESAASAVHSQVTTWADVKSGYVPAPVIGSCAAWVAGKNTSWVLDHPFDTP
ncbi:MAG: hypothetical protein LBN10_08205 [Propionibacteriaceae bacterium]|jgi:hypothetical protein|nr:hypothetical protein [Propionibacteriaceae bacterium]